MKVLLTGATGFLGRRLIPALLQRGHEVRAMVRPATTVERVPTRDRVEVVRADLRTSELQPVVDGCDAVIHAAAVVSGDPETQLAVTIRTTERLYDAMQQVGCKRVILISSFSVYDWSRVSHRLNEQTPLEEGQRTFERDAYAVSKLWQERLTNRYARANGWHTTILRPGFIWGAGNMELACLGQRIGSIWLNIAPWSNPPLTYVDNCADAIAATVGDERAHGQVFNVVDPSTSSNARFLRRLRQLDGSRTLQVPIPFAVGKLVTRLAALTSRVVFGPQGKLPSLLTPRRFEARFKPVRSRCDRLTQTLQWTPPVDFRDAWESVRQAGQHAQENTAKAKGGAGGEARVRPA